MATRGSTAVVVLISGGPDSAALTKWVQSEYRGKGTKLHAIYLKTGHPSDDQEIQAADRIMRSIGGKLEIIDISQQVRALGADRILIHSEASIMPFGNVMALSIAISYAFKLRAGEIFIGLHADDAAEDVQYTRGFIDRIEELASMAQSPAPAIRTPFIQKSKEEVFRIGAELGVDFANTWSCIRSGERHCGICGACRARHRAFMRAGLSDPTLYSERPVALESLGNR